ncbi:glycosyltransferase family 39 protein [Leptolyngbya sp. FACHB-261]|uniref:ArnT family glycosyltransferase n=1 Tax=Leptolyngbya sp. FACHB-261 TaxID=2692806 RepID=UPI001686DAEC|nr:glycosyltransferase family 39 protein [Leptolyngbya sp. FACHB-261]MBD2103187.1 glycosyltransferase family 39 protein [Leptolyngbya sp. FACHB-261]
MAILLLFASFLLILAIFYWQAQPEQKLFRLAFVKASVFLGLLISISTESLSLGRSLDYVHVTLFWAIISIISFVVLLRLNHVGFQPYRSANFFWPWAGFYLERLPRLSDLIVIAPIVLILSVSLLIALVAPPNNWDSMDYHMPRVMHWIQNRSLAHYPTYDLRQISFPPGASYIVAQFQILSGSDRFANCVQWFAFLGSIIAVSLITDIIAGKRASLISMLVCATIPMGIMQSTTTQTDLVVSFWLACFTYFIFSTNNFSGSDVFWLASSLGLSLVTKPTAIIFGAPLFLLLAFRILNDALGLRNRYLFEFLRTRAVTLLVVLVGGISLSIPSYWRNYQILGSFLGTDTGTRSTEFGLPQFISNVLKNTALNLTVPGFREWVVNIHKNLLGVSLSDSDLSLSFATEFFQGPAGTPLTLLVPHEDTVANPIHSILIMLSVIALLFRLSSKASKGSRRGDMALFQLSVVNFLGIALFCFLLKWQIWGNRLLLPEFILFSPLIAHHISTYIQNKVWEGLAILIAGVAIFYALTPMRHPILTLPASFTGRISFEQSQSILSLARQDIYFSGSRKELKVPYHEVVNLITTRTRCKSWGFLVRGSAIWEYPLWVLLKQKIDSFKFKHVEVRNESERAEPEFSDTEMCGVIAVTNSEDVNKLLQITGNWTNTVVSSSPAIAVYMRKESK